MSFIFNNILEITAAVIVVITIFRFALRKLGVAVPEKVVSWRSYIRGQGVLLFGCLVLGGAFGWLTMRYGQPNTDVASGWKVIEYRQLSIGEQAVYEDLDLSGYNHISFYAKVTSSPGTKLNVRAIPIDATLGDRNLSFDIDDSSWSRGDGQISAKHLTFAISNSHPNAINPVKADVIVVLGNVKK